MPLAGKRRKSGMAAAQCRIGTLSSMVIRLHADEVNIMSAKANTRPRLRPCYGTALYKCLRAVYCNAGEGSLDGISKPLTCSQSITTEQKK